MKNYLLLLFVCTMIISHNVSADEKVRLDPAVIPVTTKQPEEKKLYPEDLKHLAYLLIVRSHHHCR